MTDEPTTVEIRGLTFTMENNLLPPRPIPKMKSEGFNVTGEITCYFENGKLYAWFLACRACQENWALRVGRPHMPKRQWQRLRGRVKQARRESRLRRGR